MPTHLPTFEPVRRPQTAVDACVDALHDAIFDGRLPALARLPAERALAAQFGVNRTTLRAALGRLEARGLIIGRHGSGYTVQDFVRSGGPELLPGVAEQARKVGGLEPIVVDLLAMRRHLAAAVFEKLAALPCADTTALDDAIDAMDSAVKSGAEPKTIADADLLVLAAVLDLTGSAVMRMCFNPVAGVVHDLPELSDAMYADAGPNVDGWRALVAWLQLPTPRVVAPIAALLAARDDITLRRFRRAIGAS